MKISREISFRVFVKPPEIMFVQKFSSILSKSDIEIWLKNHAMRPGLHTLLFWIPSPDLFNALWDKCKHHLVLSFFEQVLESNSSFEARII